MILSISAFERISKKAGVKRISKDALDEMRDIIEELGTEIAHDAVMISHHANRKTVKKRDITFAIERKFR